MISINRILKLQNIRRVVGRSSTFALSDKGKEKREETRKKQQGLQSELINTKREEKKGFVPTTLEDWQQKNYKKTSTVVKKKAIAAYARNKI